jgi:anti-sigma B factor antagonist
VGEIGQNRSRIVLDMSQVEFLDSLVIGALVGFLRKARHAGGDVKLAQLSPDVETVFDLTRLQRVFQIYPTVDAAVHDFDVAVA